MSRFEQYKIIRSLSSPIRKCLIRAQVTDFEDFDEEWDDYDFEDPLQIKLNARFQAISLVYVIPLWREY